MKNNKPTIIEGHGRTLIHSLKNGTLVIDSKFLTDVESNSTTITYKAVWLVYDEIVGTVFNDLGAGTFEECYKLCIAKKNELEPKVYNWKNCVDSHGWYINIHSEIEHGIIESHDDRDRNYYPTKEDAESALAYCQLLHIVNKINEDYPIDATNKYKLYYEDNDFKLSYISGRLNWGGLVISEKGAELLIRDNEELLKTYFKIK